MCIRDRIRCSLFGDRGLYGHRMGERNMKHRKKLAAAAMTVLMAALMAMPAMAASRKKISSVNLEIEADIQPDTRYGEETIEVDTCLLYTSRCV